MALQGAAEQCGAKWERQLQAEGQAWVKRFGKAMRAAQPTTLDEQSLLEQEENFGAIRSRAAQSQAKAAKDVLLARWKADYAEMQTFVARTIKELLDKEENAIKNNDDQELKRLGQAYNQIEGQAIGRLDQALAKSLQQSEQDVAREVKDLMTRPPSP
jgi:hypothetical protein